MLYRQISPAPALRPYIRCYWTLRADATGDASAQRVLPDGCVEIIINLGARFIRHDAAGGAERQPLELLVGPTTRHMTIAPSGAIQLVGVRFAPGGAVPFLSVAPEEVRDAAPSLEDVASPLMGAVAERLAAAPSGTEGSVLDASLGARLAQARRLTDQRVVASVRAARTSVQSLRVDALMSLTGLGARQLERTFRDHVGFGPKTFCRLVRFQRVVRAIEPGVRTSWARVAAQHGYADQSHLAREFREFAGTNLTSYVRELHPMSDHFHDIAGVDEPLLD
jgi:AraC-like DNA-binding protein